MRLGGKISAAIAVLGDFGTRRVPLKTALADWGRGARYAGAKDRAWISGLCLDVLRRQNSLALAATENTHRALVLTALAGMWQVPIEVIEEACADEHGPQALSADERASLIGAETVLAAAASAPAAHDVPDWCQPLFARAFGDGAAREAAGLCARADIDLRLNTLKTTPEKALAALATVKAEALPWVVAGARIVAPEPSQKAPAVTVIPAFSKGWVEVQDLGSQIAAAAAGAIKGQQVLDYCAGGGGKTLALAALMENTGQLYAYDVDARRLVPVFHRAKRAGVRNLQIRSPAEGATLDELADKMDLVFVDAPCTGSGTWRRHPDAKWRLTEPQLARRIEEQTDALAAAARYVRPGGRLVYVTCSVFVEENEDRVDAFLNAHGGFRRTDALAAAMESGLLTEAGATRLDTCRNAAGDLRLTPARMGADGFYISVLTRT